MLSLQTLHNTPTTCTAMVDSIFMRWMLDPQGNCNTLFLRCGLSSLQPSTAWKTPKPPSPVLTAVIKPQQTRMNTQSKTSPFALFPLLQKICALVIPGVLFGTLNLVKKISQVQQRSDLPVNTSVVGVHEQFHSKLFGC